MKRLTAVFLGVVLLLAASVITAQAAEKFASVDIIEIVKKYNKAQDFESSIEKKAKKIDSKLQAEVNKFKKFQDKYNLLNDKQKEAKRPELEEKVRVLQELRRENETDLRKEDFDNNKQVAEDIQKAISDYAKKQGYTFVFDSRILIYQNKGLDISSQITKTLNKNYKK